MDPQARQTLVNGLRLNYLEWPGREPTFVLLHGAGLNAQAWRKVAGALAPRHRCLALDQRGHGDSEWSAPMDYRVGAYAADVAKLIDQLDVRRIVLVGHSMGAMNALAYAQQYPQRLVGLVIIDLALSTRPLDQRERHHALRAGPFESLDDAVHTVHEHLGEPSGPALTTGLSRALIRLPDGRYDWRSDQRHRRSPTIATALDDDRAAWCRQLLDGLPHLDVPTTLVRGERSDVLAEAEANEMARRLPQGELVVVAGAGHNVPRDRPGEVASILDAVAAGG